MTSITAFFYFATSIIITKLEANSVYDWATINFQQSSRSINLLTNTETGFLNHFSFYGRGKNINFAEDAQSIVVIYSYYSINGHLIYVAFTRNFGITWNRRGPFSVYNSSLAYCCLDAEPNWSQTTHTVHFTCHEEVREHYPIPAYYFKGFTAQDTFFTAQYALPNSEASDAGSPCIGIKDSFVIITKIHTIMTYDCYIWRSTNYGETWENGRVFIPGPVRNSGPYFRFGNNGYIFFLWNLGDNISQRLPYYCESFDYGLTWTQPQLLWQNCPPNPNASCLNFDCEVVRDTPVATVGLYIDNYTYNEIWVYRPDSGGPGNWRFNGTKLFGDSTSNQRLTGNPNIAADDSGNVFVGYFRYIITSDDTIPKFGLFARPAGRDTWFDWNPFIGVTIGNGYVELANNAPLILEGDSAIIAILCADSMNLWVDFVVLPNPPKITQGIIEALSTKYKSSEVTMSPNPVHNTVKFILPPFTNKMKLTIYDITGKLIRELITKNKPLTTELIWDGRKSDGGLAKSGVYFYNLSSEGNQHKGKVILTR